MENPNQRDFLIELEDARHVDSVELQAFLDRIPAKTELSTSDVCSALNVSEPTVYGLIQSGQLRARNQGTKPDGKPNYRIPRVSLIVYYKKSFV